MRIAFRVDASIQIGTGHVMRCLTLADALRERGMETVFICRELPGFSQKMIRERGHELCLLLAPDEKMQVDASQPPHAAWLGVSYDQDARETVDRLKQFDFVDWLLVDHYALDVRWETQLRSHVHRIMVIDDLADRKHDCDLFLDQTMAASSESYAGLIPSASTLLLGPQYAMLRPQFAEYREQAIEKRNRAKSIRKILVTMGGTDPYNATGTVLQGLDMLRGKDFEVTVILGASAPHLEPIKKQARCMALPVNVLSDVQNMAEVMVDHDLCIGSGGMTSWERCVLGLPTLAITLAANQEPVLKELAGRGAVKALGAFNKVVPEGIKDDVLQITDDFRSYQNMVNASQSICDGMGTKRIISALYAEALSLRPAIIEDCRIYWEWANDPDTRAASFSSAKISYETHQKWFASRLNDPSTYLFVGELSPSTQIGQVRFEKISKTVAMVSISVDKRFRQSGIGVHLLRKGIQKMMQCSDADLIIAEVKLNNIGSLKIFQKVGFLNQKVRIKASGDKFSTMTYSRDKRLVS
jgi:UDP-2,4-diacetamido-2,4,6-trideoxy-beta-L-altropyranose hydrolase